VKPETAIILAGGLGTRLRSVVADLPKPMAVISGRPFLEWLMEYWVGQGIREFILAVGYKKEAILGHFGNAYQGSSVRYAVESEPLGTGGALLCAAEKADPDKPLLVLNGDTIFRVEMEDLVSFHESKQSEWTLALFESEDNERYMQVELDAEGCVLSVGAKPEKSRFQVNGGVYVLRPSVLKAVAYRCGDRVSLEKEIIPELLAGGVRVYGETYRGLFMDIGVPEDYFLAQRMLGQGDA